MDVIIHRSCLLMFVRKTVRKNLYQRQLMRETEKKKCVMITNRDYYSPHF